MTVNWDNRFRDTGRKPKPALSSWEKRFAVPVSSFGAEGGIIMRKAAMDGFLPFTIPLEVYTDFMYTDSLGLVTTGIGNLIDDRSGPNGYGPAIGLPWQVGAGGPKASIDQIIAEWQKVKNAYPAVQSVGDKNITTLRLSADAVLALVKGKIASNEAYLKRIWPTYENAPADAQLGVNGLMWAVGAGLDRVFPNFLASLNKGDFATAAIQGHCSNCDPKRNAAQLKMFRNAAKVAALKLDYDKLYYPNNPPDAAPSNLPGIVAGVVFVAAASGAGYLYRHEISTVAKKGWQSASTTVKQANAELFGSKHRKRVRA